MPVYRAVVEGRLYFQQVVNVFHAFGFDSGLEGVIASAFVSQAQPEWAAICTSQYVFERIVVTDIVAGTQAAVDLDGGGARLDDAVAAQVAAVVSWKTAFIGPSRRGRNYFAAAPEAEIVSGLFTFGYQEAVEDLALAIRNDWLPFAGASLVIYSRLLTTFSPVTGQVVRNIPYTIRRRTIGRGI